MTEPEKRNQVGEKRVGTTEKAKPGKPMNKEEKLEQGLEESMEGSDPVAVTLPNK